MDKLQLQAPIIVSSMCQNTKSFQRHASRWKVEFRSAPACEGPGSFWRHELIVYIITHCWSLSSPQRWNKQDAHQNHYSQVWKAVTFLRVTFVSALSHLLAHFAWAGEICATCHCSPARPWDWWNTFWEEVTAADRVFTSFCVEETGRWPLINTVFTHRAENDRADSISEDVPFAALLWR